jgi:hypothetical protein
MRYLALLLINPMNVLPLVCFANEGGGGGGGYFRQLEQLFVQEQGSLATRILAEDLAGGTDAPKEISIHCPGVILSTKRLCRLNFNFSNIVYIQTPEVSIRDLLRDEAMMHGDNTCM